MKTEMFKMRVYVGELFEAKTKLTKKEFWDTLKRNKAVLDDPANEFCDFNLYEQGKANDEGYGYREQTIEKETYTINEYVFTRGMSAIFLIHIKAKEGYHFK